MIILQVPRDKDEPGKGGFWMINSEYEEYFKNGVLKRRKNKKKIQKVPYSRSSSYTKAGQLANLCYQFPGLFTFISWTV